MNVDERLRRLVEAERAAAAPPGIGTGGWKRLTHAVSNGAEALSVPLATIPVSTASLVGEGIAVALVVGTIGATAIVATAPARRTVIENSTQTSAVVVAPNRVAGILTPPSSVLAAAEAEAAESATAARSRAPHSPKSQSRNGSPTQAATTLAAEAESVAVAEPTSTLDAEMRLISQAKQQLDLGKPHLARVWLDEHRARFPGGVLSAERDGLEVLMTCGRSNSDAARAKAQAYVSKYPGSPAVDRILRSCFRSATDTNSK